MSDVFNTILSDCLVLSDEDASAFARAHQLSAYTESDGAGYRLERQVSQWVGGHFLCWEEHWLKESEQRAIRLISPEARWLSSSEAARLLCASRAQGQLESIGEGGWQDSKVA